MGETLAEWWFSLWEKRTLRNVSRLKFALHAEEVWPLTLSDSSLGCEYCGDQLKVIQYRNIDPNGVQLRSITEAGYCCLLCGKVMRKFFGNMTGAPTIDAFLASLKPKVVEPREG